MKELNTQQMTALEGGGGVTIIFEGDFGEFLETLLIMLAGFVDFLDDHFDVFVSS